MPKAGVGNFKRIEANISSLRGVAVTSVICVIMSGKSKMSWDRHLQEMIEEFRGKDWIDLNWKRRWNANSCLSLDCWFMAHKNIGLDLHGQSCLFQWSFTAFTQLSAALWVQSLNSRAVSTFNKISKLWVTNYLVERRAPGLQNFPGSGWWASCKTQCLSVAGASKAPFEGCGDICMSLIYL